MAIDTKNLFASFKTRVEAQLNAPDGNFDALDILGAVTEIFEPRDVVYSQGELCDDMFVVSDGWLIGSSTVRDGGRYLHRIYQAGDIIGSEDINWNYGTSTTEAVTSCILGRFPKGRLFSLFAASPALAAAIHGVAMNDVVVTMDIARANSRLNAAGRVGHLLLQVKARQALMTVEPGDVVNLPLTQTQIADALGLTNVSVSRAVSDLASRGLIERDGTRYTLLKPAELESRSNFINRYTVSSHEWMGSVREALCVATPPTRPERNMSIVRSNTG